MTKELLADQVREVIAENMAIDKHTVTPEALLSQDLNIDSLDAVEITLALEDTFDIEIPDNIIDHIATATVQNVIDLVAMRKLDPTHRQGPEKGAIVNIPLVSMEYAEGGDTIWFQTLEGTAFRLKVPVMRSVVCQDGGPTHGDAQIFMGMTEVVMCLDRKARY